MASEIQNSVRNQTMVNGLGVRLYYWRPGLARTRAQFPMKLTQITHNGIATPSLDTTHLGSGAPEEKFEFGGRTYMPATLSDPGQLTLEGFLNPSAIMPKGMMMLQIVFPLARGDLTQAKWHALGFVTQRGSITITTDALITQQNVIQLSGRVAMTPATHRVRIVPPEEVLA